MNTVPRSLLLLAAILLAGACKPGGDATPPATAEAEAPAAAQEAVPDGTPCAPTSARELIEGLALEDEASGCTVYLPLDPAPGTLTVRVSVAGTDDQAAVEWTEDGERVFADRGEVVIHTVEDGRLTGTVRAEASAGARVLRTAGDFSVPLAPAP